MSNPSNRDEASPLRAPTPPSNGPSAARSRWVWSEEARNRLDAAGEFINDHPRAFRAVPWVIGGAGLLLLVTNTAVFRRFRLVSAIPARLFQRNAKLTGIAATTTGDTLGVWHTPGASRILFWGQRPPSSSKNGLLKVSCAGVLIADHAATRHWLQQAVIGKRVVLTLLSRAEGTASCVVHTKGVRGACVNEQLLARGLATQTEVTGFRQSQDWVSFVTLLGRAEGGAKRKGVGLWKGRGHETLYWKFRNKVKKS